MTKKEKTKKDARPKHFLKEWREFRRLTQEALAEKAKTTKGVVSLIENNERGLSDKWKRKFAPALGVQPGWLIDYHPEEVGRDLMEIWGQIPQEKREQAILTLESFVRKTGTEG